MQTIANKIAILGIPLDNVDSDGALDAINTMIDQFQSDGVARYVTTPNVDFLVNVLSPTSFRASNPALAAAYHEADLSIADGMPLVTASRLFGTPLRGRVAGSDLVPKIFAECQGLKIYALGGDDRTLKHVAAIIDRLNPTIQIVGSASPFILLDGKPPEELLRDDESIVAAINNAQPDVLLLALGNPKQELWFRRNRHRLRVPVSIGIGGTFNFIVGRIRRAPRWLQMVGLEWLYRVYAEPRRLWKRYAKGLVVFGSAFLAAYLADRLLRLTACGPVRHRRREPRVEMIEGVGVVQGAYRLTAKNISSHKARALEAARSSDFVLLDLNGTAYCDAAGLGFIAALKQSLEGSGKLLRLAGPSQRLRTQMVWQRFWPVVKDFVLPDRQFAVDQLAAMVAAQNEAACKPIAAEMSPSVSIYGESLDHVENTIRTVTNLEKP